MPISQERRVKRALRAVAKNGVGKGLVVLRVAVLVLVLCPAFATVAYEQLVYLLDILWEVEGIAERGDTPHVGEVQRDELRHRNGVLDNGRPDLEKPQGHAFNLSSVVCAAFDVGKDVALRQ